MSSLTTRIWIPLSGVIVVLILTSSLSLAAYTESVKSPEMKVPQIFNYGDYVEKFRKSYSQTETLNKAKIFFGRTFKIFQHNVLYLQSKVSYFLQQNQFTDLTSEELKLKYSNNENTYMRPVVEAAKNPDAPADLFEFTEAHSLSPSESRSGETKSKLTATMMSLTQNSDQVNKVHQSFRKPVNFMDDQNVNDLSETLHRIKSNPDLAKQMALVVSYKPEENKLTPLDDLKKLESNQVEHRAMVDSNNKYYDPQMITSYGLFSSDRTWDPENYARYLVDDGLQLDPYPSASVPLTANDRKSPFGALLSSVKNIFEYMIDDGFEDDEEDEEETDLEQEETKIEEKKEVEQEQPRTDVEEIPSFEEHKNPEPIVYDIDWRATGCISKPQSQMSCNSCYAFATLSLMEYFYCKQSKKLTSFSSQYVVDCGSKLSLNGCQGGKISLVGSFINKYGIELESLYPYNGRENTCPYNEEDESKKKSGYLRPVITHWQMFPEMAAWSKWVKKSPIIVGINMPTDFLAYGGGIHDGLDCTQDMVHALLLIGSGSEDGKKFWLLKNSYAEGWGENGYFRLSKSAPVRCFNAATVVRADFSKATD